MKKTILILLTLLNVLIVNSQTDSTINLRLNRLESNNDLIKTNLTKCHKQWTTGLGVVGSGFIVSGFGILISSTNGVYKSSYNSVSNPKDGAYIIGAGGLISLIGSIIMIDSHKYIGRTGLNIQPGKITYTFN